MKHRPKWIDRAISTQNFHAEKVKANPAWTIELTAKALRRSIGGISEDLLIVSWLKTHEHRITSFKYAYQALDYIRKHKKIMSAEAYNA